MRNPKKSLCGDVILSSAGLEGLLQSVSFCSSSLFWFLWFYLTCVIVPLPPPPVPVDTEKRIKEGDDADLGSISRNNGGIQGFLIALIM